MSPRAFRWTPLVTICFVTFFALTPLLSAAQSATPVPAASPVASPAANRTCQVGRQDDGSVLLPTNQLITPVGDQIEFEGRPNDVAVRPDGKTAVFLTNSRSLETGSEQPIVVVDLTTGKEVQGYTPDPEAPAGSSYTGILYSPDGNTVFASDVANNRVMVANVAEDGTLTDAGSISFGGSAARPGGMAISEDGKTLYVVLNMANALAIVDVESQTETARIPVGNAPFDVVINGNTAYVSNQGGRKAEAGDTVRNSAGTDIVVDPVTGASRTGTVSVIDLEKQSVTAVIDVELQPSALLLNDTMLFVANTNSDTISVIDTTTNEVAKTISIRIFPGALWGSSPNALAMVGDKLLVSLGRNNAIAVYTWAGAAEAVNFDGMIPTGWYPSAISVDAANERIVVSNAKGVGSLGPEAAAGPEAENPTSHYVHMNEGSASIIPFGEFQTADVVMTHTQTVLENNQWAATHCQQMVSATPAASASASPVATAGNPIPTELGGDSPIKYVFYIVKENRTYDQVFGDFTQANGDPSLVQFGREVTPNHHAMAEQWQIMDNLYVSGSLSADGHQWVTQAYNNDYVERMFSDWWRSYPYGDDAMSYVPTGFLWDNAMANGQTVNNYGEYTNRFEAAHDPNGNDIGTWTDWYNDYLILSGQAEGTPRFNPGVYQTSSDVPALDTVTNRSYPGWTMTIPDVYRANIFVEDFNQSVANGNVSNLTFIYLPNDHTSGTQPGMPTPKASMADNDAALGMVVDAISHSDIWDESAIFIIEDDAQNGVDHVDGHRTIGMVISPWAKRGIVDSTYYTQIDMVRTIEQILGLPPMNQMDMAATPMYSLFTNTPDFTPYDYIPVTQPLDELNPTEAQVSGVEAAWAEWSDEQGFADYEDIEVGPDAKDENLLNHAIWYATQGFDTPYPGDERVLLPSEVEPALEDEEEEDEIGTTIDRVHEVTWRREESVA